MLISTLALLLLFVDKTGRPGPANWEAGTYPDAQDNFPVTGVSWYEAAAFAVYANKQLPTVFHWSVVAETGRTQFIVALSNFSGKSTTAVGSNTGYSTFGIYDIAGNAREWCSNSNESKQAHYILGGGWNDPSYAFNDTYIQQTMDRSMGNGFRCIKALPGDTAIMQLMKPVSMAFRDYKKEKPVDDKTFNIIRQQFLYDKTALNEKIETYYPILKEINDADFSMKSSPEKWSKKEELGHLIDSAQNNIQRFIRVQCEENVHILYHPDNWVLMNDYQNIELKKLVELWYLLNQQIISILQKMPKEKQETLMSYSKDASIKDSTLFIAEDYLKHMEHHLESITSK